MKMIIAFIILVVLGVIALVLWHSRKTTYWCPKCKKKFKISFLMDFLSPHWIWKGGYKYVKCPNCKIRVRAKEILFKN